MDTSSRWVSNIIDDRDAAFCGGEGGAGEATPSACALAATLQRSTSAPPSLVPDPSHTPDPSFADLKSQEYRMDPGYHQYYFSRRPPDPRLPPPIFWWNWTVPAPDVGTLKPQGAPQQRGGYPPHPKSPPLSPVMKADVELVRATSPRSRDMWAGAPLTKQQLQQYQNRANVVDMIQRDFPRTPSPVYQERQPKEQQPAPAPVSKKPSIPAPTPVAAGAYARPPAAAGAVPSPTAVRLAAATPPYAAAYRADPDALEQQLQSLSIGNPVQQQNIISGYPSLAYYQGGGGAPAAPPLYSNQYPMAGNHALGYAAAAPAAAATTVLNTPYATTPANASVLLRQPKPIGMPPAAAIVPPPYYGQLATTGWDVRAATPKSRHCK
eukprot:TRINITY_DN239_c0_g1_i2.p1 TRINITY_DN239_c0_g1~~TRINITY_DN239_c0_g1_i2.p1  ORF type:complete len:409 (+),score=94.51 TRINITY_DN239_c0_g1_i2:88-1227(+)